MVLSSFALPSILDAIHCLKNRSIIPAKKIDSGIHRWVFPNKKPTAVTNIEIIIAELIFIIIFSLCGR